MNRQDKEEHQEAGPEEGEHEGVGWLGFHKLGREDRKELLSRVEAGARTDIDFIVMMVLSVGLAGLGLLQGSTAVVIGAMLVAPLMGPLVGAGLALAQANARLFRSSMQTTGVGLTVGLAVSLVVGLINPGYEASMEIEARGAPDVLDLGIALLAGMAAAWALGRPGVSGTLAGVAIAAALVPPLAVVGIALTNDRPDIGVFAAILVSTNVVAITLGAAMIFRILGAPASLAGREAPLWVRRMGIAFMIAVMGLAAPLVGRVIERTREGQSRPLSYPVAEVTRVAVNQYMRDWPQYRLLTLGRISVEPHTGITVIIEASKPVPASFDRELKEVIRTARGEDVPVQIFALAAAWDKESTDWESQDPDSPNQQINR